MVKLQYSIIPLISILNEFLGIYKNRLHGYWSSLTKEQRERDIHIEKKKILEINIKQLEEMMSYIDKIELISNKFHEVIFKFDLYVMKIEKKAGYHIVTLNMEYKDKIVSDMFIVYFYNNSMKNYDPYHNGNENYIKELYDAIEIDKKENLIHE